MMLQGSPVVNDQLYVHSSGDLTATPSTSTQVIALVTKAAGAFDSGVPGVDVNGSLTLGNFVEFKLLI